MQINTPLDRMFGNQMLYALVEICNLDPRVRDLESLYTTFFFHRFVIVSPLRKQQNEDAAD